MPSIFELYGYKVFFWSNENSEPIHVNISKGRPAPNSTKVWLTKRGGCILANNNSKIPDKDLNSIMETIASNFLILFQNEKKLIN